MGISSDAKLLIYFGTYTERGSRGIYLSQLDISSGRMGPVSLAAEINSPSFLAIHPTGEFLYAVSGIGKDSPPMGSVHSFAIDRSTGALKYMNQASSGGEGPCHVDIDTTGKHLLVANYIGESVAVLPINRDGTIGGPTDIHQHNGSSVNIERQEGPHPHSANLDSNNRFVYVADLGLDEVCVYELLAEGTLKYREQLSVDLKAGAGPRHFDFHPNGEYAYVINELDSTVTVFSLDGGKLDPIQTLSTLPKEFAGISYTADIHVAKSGRFLYGSNRGHDSIVIFSIDENTGKLTYVNHEPTRGIYPRNFEIDPSGLLMLVANQDSDTVLTFNIDQQTGTLESTGHVIEVPYPVCIQLVWSA